MEKRRVSDDPVGGLRLQEGDAERRLVASTTAHAIFELDPAGAITSWSRPAVSLYGYSRTDVLGEPVATLFDAPADLDPPLAAVLERAAVESERLEACQQRADGTTFWATLTISPLRSDVDGFAVVAQDTTASRAYRHKLERQNDRLKEFTDILVHDLRNPLHVIDTRLDLYFETGDETHLESLAETTDRMERLVDDLLRVARQGNLVTDPQPTDIEAVTRTAWEGAVGQSQATLVAEAVPTVQADPDRLCELFENLFRNAVEHGSTSPPSHTREDAIEHAGEGVTVRVGSLEEGFYVEDDGPGIPSDLREDVFDHGVSTVEDGTGYGLSVVRTIASAHDWDVVATDAHSGGARFEFTGVDVVE
jgi:PAS domain S-box-containing protein